MHTRSNNTRKAADVKPDHPVVGQIKGGCGKTTRTE